MRWLPLALALAAPLQDEPAVAPKDGVIKLFNGKDLTGFYPFLRGVRREDRGRYFTVQDGLLRVSGEANGYLSTEKAYRDYRLVAEFRWGAKNAPAREGAARSRPVPAPRCRW